MFKIIATQLAAAQAANNEKEIKNLTTYKSAIDGGFAGSGAADCETLQNMYASKVEAAKDDLPALKEIVSLLRRVRCQEIDAFIQLQVMPINWNRVQMPLWVLQNRL